MPSKVDPLGAVSLQIAIVTWEPLIILEEIELRVILVNHQAYLLSHHVVHAFMVLWCESSMEVTSAIALSYSFGSLFFDDPHAFRFAEEYISIAVESYVVTKVYSKVEKVIIRINF